MELDSKSLTDERMFTHGDWKSQSATADALLEVLSKTKNWHNLRPYQRQALTLIATKISRIVNGDPTHEDHWDDIGGYALLGKEGHTNGERHG